MKLKINSINLEDEVIWIEVLNDCSLKYYMVMDTTFLPNNNISNEHRHVYWFPEKKVVKGDWVKLFTHNGANTSVKNDAGTTTYIFYWDLGNNVWNNTGDAAVLFEINIWETKKAR